MSTDALVSFDDALSALRREYYSDVRDFAQEIKQAIADDEIADREELYTRVNETVDGTQWVIYTQRAMIVLLVSDNDSAYADEYGAEGVVDGGDIAWSRLAYAAMERDLFEQLEAEGVNVNGDTKAEMLGEEEEEEEEEEPA